MSNDKKAVLLCLTVEGDPRRYIVPDSIEERCNDCGVAIWVSPSGQRLMKEEGAIPVCMSCGLARMEKEPGEVEEVLGQAQEIKAWRKRN